MNVSWAILCESAIVDKDTNNVSLVNVVEELTLPAAPPEIAATSDPSQLKPVSLAIVTLFARSDPSVPESGEAQIKIVAPDGRIGLSGQISVDLIQHERLRAIGRTFQMPFPDRLAGQYLLKVEVKTAGLDWEEMFSLPLQVKVQTDDLPD